jgi:hypothetical protein
MKNASLFVLALGVLTAVWPVSAQPTRSQVVREQRELLRAGKFDSLQKFANAMSRQTEAMGEGYPDSFYFCEAFEKPLSTKTGDLAWTEHHADLEKWIAKYEVNFQKGIKADPNFLPIYYAKVVYLLPRWHGKPGDVERFAEEAADHRGGEDGDMLYMFIVRRLAEADGKANVFDYAEISWPRMKRGFEARVKNPRNRNLEMNHYCYFACLKNERSTAKRLFEEIGSQWRKEAWGNQGVFEQWRKWAGS